MDVVEQAGVDMRPNYEDMLYFIEVQETKNISRAAQRLGITQPSLSTAMKRLESSLGVDLLLRNRSGVQLTQPGKKFAKMCQKFLVDWDNLQKNIVHSHEKIEGSITLGCHPSVGLYTLPKLLPCLANHFPSLKINLFHDISRNVSEKLISRQIDVGLVINPTTHPELDSTPLLKDEVGFWASSSPTNQQCHFSSDLTLIADTNLKQTQRLLKPLKAKKLKLIECNNLEVIASMVANGLGLGVLPKRVALNTNHHLIPFSSFLLQNHEQNLPILQLLKTTVEDDLHLVFRTDADLSAKMVNARIVSCLNNE